MVRLNFLVIQNELTWVFNAIRKSAIDDCVFDEKDKLMVTFKSIIDKYNKLFSKVKNFLLIIDNDAKMEEYYKYLDLFLKEG